MGLLDKGGTVKDSLTGTRENQALKAARAKRDADEAGLSNGMIYIHFLKIV
jgi:hypothetical protein